MMFVSSEVSSDILSSVSVIALLNVTSDTSATSWFKTVKRRKVKPITSTTNMLIRAARDIFFILSTLLGYFILATILPAKLGISSRQQAEMVTMIARTQN